jgi:stage V sporulation protein G
LQDFFVFSVWRFLYEFGLMSIEIENAHEQGGDNTMQITDVRLRRVQSDGRMKAIASITIDHEFVVHDIRVIEGLNGVFVAMPSKRTPDGEFRDIAHPISSTTRDKIQRAVLDVFEQSTELEPVEAGA